MSLNIAQSVQAAVYESSADNGMAYLSGHNIIELNCNYRRNVIVGIGVVGVAGTKCRSGQKKHQTESRAAKITMTKQIHSLLLPDRQSAL